MQKPRQEVYYKYARNGMEKRERSVQEKLWDAVRRNSGLGVRRMIALGGDPMEPNKAGLNAVELAAWKNAPAAARELFAAGALPENPAKKSRVLASYIAYMDEACLEIFISAGANPAEAGEHGRSPLMDSARSSKPGVIARLLRDPRVALASHLNLSNDSRDNMTALDYAVFYNNPAAVRELLRAGAAIESIESPSGLHAGKPPRGKRSALRRSALSIACIYEDDPNLPIAKMLISAGADLNFINTAGETPLEWATQSFGAEQARLTGQQDPHVQELLEKKIMLLLSSGATLSTTGPGSLEKIERERGKAMAGLVKRIALSMVEEKALKEACGGAGSGRDSKSAARL